MKRSPQLWMVLFFLVAAATTLRLHGNVDRVPPSQPLSEMPSTLGPWHASDIPLDASVLEVLGKGIFLNRVYSPLESAPPTGTPLDRAPVQLFIGYFPTQRTGQAIHSPQNCLPGAGWSFDSSGVIDLTDPQGKAFQVGEYVISNGNSKAEVLYWYRSHGRSIASDYKAKLYTLADSIRYNRTDAALVRIVTPLMPGEGRAGAHQRAVAFAEQLSPLLPAYIPD